MNKVFTGLIAAILSLGIMGSTMQTADAGKRERRIAAGIGIGILGAAIIAGSSDRNYRHNRRYRSNRYARPHRNYRRHKRAQRRFHRQNRRYYRQQSRYNRQQVRFSAAHKGWCSTKYRSYRAWDNTFQPYHGPRRACYSPYN